jgi:hypothetical protein
VRQHELSDKEVGELWKLHYQACQHAETCNECRLIRKFVEERAKHRGGVTAALSWQLALSDFGIDPKTWKMKQHNYPPWSKGLVCDVCNERQPIMFWGVKHAEEPCCEELSCINTKADMALLSSGVDYLRHALDLRRSFFYGEPPYHEQN